MSFGKKDIIKNVSSKAQISSENSSIFLKKFLDLIKQTSKSKIIKISNYGAFSMKTTPQRVGRNPKTKEEFIILKRSKLSFKPSNKVRSLIN